LVLKWENIAEENTVLIGLMADTHDNLPMVDKAVHRFNEENVGLVLHAGDYVAPFVIPRLKALKARFIGVTIVSIVIAAYLRRRKERDKSGEKGKVKRKGSTSRK
jgi:hypothetical protein